MLPPGRRGARDGSRSGFSTFLESSRSRPLNPWSLPPTHLSDRLLAQEHILLDFVMALKSNLFAGDSKLETAAVSDAAHIVQGARGDHVQKIQTALQLVDGAV